MQAIFAAPKSGFCNIPATHDWVDILIKTIAVCWAGWEFALSIVQTVHPSRANVAKVTKNY